MSEASIPIKTGKEEEEPSEQDSPSPAPSSASSSACACSATAASCAAVSREVSKNAKAIDNGKEEEPEQNQEDEITAQKLPVCVPASACASTSAPPPSSPRASASACGPTSVHGEGGAAADGAQKKAEAAPTTCAERGETERWRTVSVFKRRLALRRWRAAVHGQLRSPLLAFRAFYLDPHRLANRIRRMQASASTSSSKSTASGMSVCVLLFLSSLELFSLIHHTCAVFFSLLLSSTLSSLERVRALYKYIDIKIYTYVLHVTVTPPARSLTFTLSNTHVHTHTHTHVHTPSLLLLLLLLLSLSHSLPLSPSLSLRSTEEEEEEAISTDSILNSRTTHR
jgi:hypothetical protein